MAVRTTDTEVRQIIETDTSIDLIPFITVASSMVTELCTDSNGNEVHGTERMTLIETWLAAHFYAIRDMRLAEQNLSFMEYSESYQYKVGLNLQVTMYGQQVLILDTSGAFAAMNKMAEQGKSVVGVNWLGTELS